MKTFRIYYNIFGNHQDVFSAVQKRSEFLETRVQWTQKQHAIGLGKAGKYGIQANSSHNPPILDILQFKLKPLKVHLEMERCNHCQQGEKMEVYCRNYLAQNSFHDYEELGHSCLAFHQHWSGSVVAAKAAIMVCTHQWLQTCTS